MPTTFRSACAAALLGSAGSAAGLVALVLVAPAAAVADLDLDVGDRVPPFRPRGYVNTEPVNLASLSGRVVLLETFRTDVPKCRDTVAHLDALQAKYGERGLTVISITTESRSQIERFVEATKATHAFVSERTDTAYVLGVGAFPYAFLVDVEGTIAWSGHSDNVMPDIVEAELRKVRRPPKLPDSMAAIRKLLDARKYGEARRALERVASPEKVPGAGTTPGTGTKPGTEKMTEADRTAVAEAIAWIDALARRRMDLATVDGIKGDVVSAAEGLERLAAEFKGSEIGENAAKGLKELLADPARRKEYEAAKDLVDLHERIATMRTKKAYELVKAFVADHAGTKAADEARVLLKELEPETGK